MKISVAMATYNGEKYIYEQIKSIASQSIVPDELIICDDCSSDATIDIIEKCINEFKNLCISYSINDVNVGYAQNFFRALSKASGDYIFLADQDDIWARKKVEVMMNIVRKNPDITCLSCKNIIVDSSGNVIKKEKSEKSMLTQISFRDVVEQKRLRPGMSLLITKGLKDEVLIKNIDKLEQHDRFIEAIATLYGKFELVDEYLNKYRIHNNNTSGLNLTHKPIDGLQGRIRQTQKEIRYLKILQDVDVLNSEQMQCVYDEKQYFILRSELLQNNNIAKYILNLSKIIKRLSSPQILLGDIYCMVKSKN